jgi:small subunit ribosomal protein S11
MLSTFKSSLKKFISRNSNLNSLYLYRNLSISFQKRLLTSSSNNNNNDNDKNKPEEKEEKEEIEITNKNEINNNSRNQPNIDDILGLFSSSNSSSSAIPSSSSSSSPSSEPSDKGIDQFLFNFQSNKPKSSHSSSPNSEIAKLLSDFLVPSEETYILHIHASYNNTLVTLTNSRGDILITKSGGSVGFKKAQRGGYEAAHQAAVGVIRKIKEKDLNVKNVEICIKGFGPGRDAAFKALANVENQWNIKRITDTTPLPFNGCRPRKARRL